MGTKASSVESTDEHPADPRVSVVIPVFNRADCIVEAVESCLRQTAVADLEVVVVDDCSTDDTAGVVSAIKDTRVRLVRHERNLGGAAARNTGIDKACGRFIAFLDSDDVWDSDKLVTQMGVMRGRASAQATACHCKIRAKGPHREEVIPKRGVGSGESVAEYLFVQGGHIQTSSLLVPAELARKARFDPALRKHQDYDFCLRLERSGATFVMVEQPLLTWHHDDRPDRITHRYGLNASEYFLQTRAHEMGVRATDAFWVKHIFLKRLRSKPANTLFSFLNRMFRGPLPIYWYARWFVDGARRFWQRAH